MRRLVLSLAILIAALPAADVPRKIEISAKRFAFSPAEITLKKGEPVVLVLTSEDVAHGLKVEPWNIRVDFSKGHPAMVDVTPTESGDVDGVCSHFCGNGHGRMRMVFHVIE